MSNFKLLAVPAFALILAGCPQNTIPDADPTDVTYEVEDSSADTRGMDGSGDPYGGESFGEDDPTAGELAMVIYFEFDSSEVRPEDQEVVARHAMQLGNNPGARVRLEGHADERGSREYNIGLGERRAQAVRRMLMVQGVAADQISTVSFGEERPVAFGSSESDYAQNRRVKFTYVN
jgi:peptidoglycan-associated lipoprotein